MIEIVAVAVDSIQHAKYLEVDGLPRVVFKSFGADAIAEADGSFDIVLMIKALHPVSGPAMDDASSEIHRVLEPLIGMDAARSRLDRCTATYPQC